MLVVTWRDWQGTNLEVSSILGVSAMNYGKLQGSPNILDQLEQSIGFNQTFSIPKYLLVIIIFWATLDKCWHLADEVDPLIWASYLVALVPSISVLNVGGGATGWATEFKPLVQEFWVQVWLDLVNL